MGLVGLPTFEASHYCKSPERLEACGGDHPSANLKFTSSQCDHHGNLNFSLLSENTSYQMVSCFCSQLSKALQYDRRTECKASLLYCAHALQNSRAAGSKEIEHRSYGRAGRSFVMSSRCKSITAEDAPDIQNIATR
jgi:hypothetical protein